MGNPRGHLKRQEVSLDDGWTIITHATPTSRGKKGKNKKSANSLAQDMEKLSLSPGRNKPSKTPSPAPVQPAEEYTVDSLIAEYEEIRKKWDNTACKSGTEAILKEKTWDLDTALCFGIGSFTIPNLNRLRSMWQLVLFLSAIDLVTASGKEPKVFAQEPCFNALDKDFLQSLSVGVLETDAQNLITDKSLVYSPFVDWRVLLPEILKGRDPGLYIGNDILDDYTLYASDETEEEVAECNQIAREFRRGRESVRVPPLDLHAGALMGMMIYRKKGMRRRMVDS